jgi:hypothetical protein
VAGASAAVGLLAWPSTERLYLMDGTGRVLVSTDSGRTLEELGSVGGEPAALASAGAGELFAALHDGTIVHSTDGGATWAVRSSS